MRPQDIKIGESYRFKEHPTIGYAKVIRILKKHEGVNTKNYTIVKCEHTVLKNDTMGFTRYFKPDILMKL